MGALTQLGGRHYRPKPLEKNTFTKSILCIKWEISQGYPKKRRGIHFNNNIRIWYVIWVHLNTARNTWGWGREVPCFLSIPKGNFELYLFCRNE